ncbi:hypothetical protein BC629DRAFT_1571817 [Irpex lacteus]|nr:hypothetical protein BC629DRAFT_1571817 [Irpex lacteus]
MYACSFITSVCNHINLWRITFVQSYQTWEMSYVFPTRPEMDAVATWIVCGGEHGQEQIIARLYEGFGKKKRLRLRESNLKLPPRRTVQYIHNGIALRKFIFTLPLVKPLLVYTPSLLVQLLSPLPFYRDSLLA